jgi:hypothetical protein
LKENFDRFNFAIYKEKEMVDFRRWITAIAVLALFAGLACAQVNSSSAGTGSLQCAATVAAPPALRAEGMTELIGDIVLVCSGGVAPATNSVVPTANITVSLGTNVTSRLLGTGGVTNASEALLLIDEPGSPSALGPGPALPQTPCATPGVGAGPGGCVQVVNPTAGPTLGQTATCDAFSNGVCTTYSAAKNVFQGLVTANQVTFNGVPLNPPVSSGTARVFRITNVRANVAGLGGGGLAGQTALAANVIISGSTALLVNNAVFNAGFIQTGLSASLRNIRNDASLSAPAFAQCAGATTSAVAVLQYSENFGTAFKTRVNPAATNSGGNGQSSTAIQNVPGQIYNSESGFTTSVVPNAGLADYGTRLKAVFNNVPAGVRLFVSTTNVFNTNSSNPTAPLGTVTTTSFAQLVLSETAGDANGFPPLTTSTATVNGSSINTAIAEIPVVNGTAMAVWEVVNTNPSALENFYFGVWTTFTANPGSNSPPAGSATVNMSFAPTPPIAFTASAGSAASSSLSVPRFVDTSSGQSVLSIALCNTVLLYPFVTNQGGFDTGLAIANTSTDPFGTRTQSGTCDLNFYGTSAPPKVTTANIATGTVYTTLASTAAAGFQGYMIAVCQFQLAHGFAFISDLGARNLAMGYLALVLPTGTGSRNSGSLLFNGSTSAVVEDTGH